ncbi:MAG: mechanosensitive ion channel [Nitrospirae bacterium]|nr:mechanosensitive ion channel [Nitrospirota bacterium]
MDATLYVNKAMELVILYAPKFLFSIALLFLGLWAIKLVLKAVTKAMSISKLEPSLHSFLKTLISMALKVLLFISVASMLGIATTSFVAILGAAGLAVGLALQSNLANFAGGVLVLLLKPFRIGDVITAQGFTGKVSEIQIFHTIVKTTDNKTIIIPNGPLSGGTIVNFSTEALRRLDMTFGIGYSEDITKVKGIFQKLISENNRILITPEPSILVTEITESSVKISVTLWCNSADYTNIASLMPETVNSVFHQEGIKITFP